MKARLFVAAALAATLGLGRATVIGQAPRGGVVGAVTGGPTGGVVYDHDRVDAVFAKYNASTPGCAVGVATDGKAVLTGGYGSADLEHDVPITPETIFEAGSVSKQFTAASVLLLAREGKLSIDDPVRKYIPELPDSLSAPLGPGAGSGPFPVQITIRHMLSHTSGLRDWGSVAAIAGWPRTTRVHTHAHVLEIVSHQKSLNFRPGTRWSYSNTGFNLAAIIVERVSGMSFQEFTRARLFQPLGMSHTSWRDDFTRIVKGRAIAYDENRASGAFATDMPFENVYGNGGLLTTVGDLLMWNENFATPVVGNASFVAEQQQAGKFSDGRTHGYALGLFVGKHKGLREVYHSGSTAGYSAFLTRFPDQHLSVAVLCNVDTARATQYAHDVADVYLGDRLKPEPPVKSEIMLLGEETDNLVGVYRNQQTGVPLVLARDRNGVRVERGRGGALAFILPSRFVDATGQTWDVDGRGALHVTDEFGTVDVYEKAPTTKPTVAQLQELAGTYESGEAETTLTAAVEDGGLVLKRRPATTIKLTSVYADAFNAGSLGVVIFRRDATGRVTALSVVQDRVWDLRFARRSN
jgi:CubicO group peptidase (beta-lactamase class C family)